MTTSQVIPARPDSLLKDHSEDVHRVLGFRHGRPFFPRLEGETLTPGEVRAAIEMAYRRGYQQGAYLSQEARAVGIYDRWFAAVTRWRYRFTQDRTFELPPEPTMEPAKGITALVGPAPARGYSEDEF